MALVQFMTRIIAPLARLGELIAGAAMFGIMVIAMADVTARYLFVAPLAWSFDLIMWFLMPMVFFFALGSTGLRRDHVDIDVLYRFMPPWLQRASMLAGTLASIAVYTLIVYLGWGRARVAWSSGELMNGVLEWPTWIYLMLVPIGFGLLVVVLVQQVTDIASGGKLAEPAGEIDTAGVR